MRWQHLSSEFHNPTPVRLGEIDAVGPPCRTQIRAWVRAAIPLNFAVRELGSLKLDTCLL